MILNSAVTLPDPPVPATNIEFRLPKGGDWLLDEHGHWSRATFNYQSHRYLCFTPAPQGPKKVIGYRKGTQFWRVGNVWAAETPNGARHTFAMTSDNFQTQTLRNVDPQIKEFTTTEDGTSL